MPSSLLHPFVAARDARVATRFLFLFLSPSSGVLCNQEQQQQQQQQASVSLPRQYQ
jgi:hypothetical protein